MRASTSHALLALLWSSRSKSTSFHLGIVVLIATICAAITGAPTSAQVSGQNVNMVSGTNWTNGDPFLQRQNEPSIAVSSRNPSHLLAGANDYRTVDLPGLLGIDERGDAWLGLFKSFDAGRRWQSTLLPGFPLDGSSEGLASPIHGFQAASDPTVRAGTNGLFYYTGIAYNRGTKPLSAVFIARFIDLNNKENGSATFENGSITNLAPRDTIKYIDTQIIGRGTPDVFLDKPWLAVDIPRGHSTCTFSVNQDGKTITQTVPAGPVYVTATSFVGSGAKQFSEILFRRSLDCGVTWSVPVILSRNDEPFGDGEHQGTVIAIDPSVPPSEPATVYVAWRRFASANDPDEPPAIFLAKSADGGAHWGTPFAVVMFPNSCIQNPGGVGCPFDQIFTSTSFRSNGYPALTVDSGGRVYVAWSQRDANGDGKIMMGIAPGGRSIQPGSIAKVDIGPVTDDNDNAFSNLSGRGSQLMPSLSFAAGKLVLAYYDLRQDHTAGIYVPSPNPACDPMVILPCALGGQYFENRTLEGELAPPNPYNNPAVFSPNIGDSNPPLAVRRHTIDLMAAQADLQAGTFPSFKTFRVSRYEFGSVPALFPDVEQLQYNVPNLPLFVDGTAPFMGDYIDVTGTPQIVPTGNGDWTFNVADTGTAVFHTAWTDNRDVIPPADGNWQHYTPPISASNPGSQPSKFDPTANPPACLAGQTGMRNQNVYTAEISSGVILTSPQTSKPVLTPDGQPVQREFVVELRNATNAARSFLVTIPTQPLSATASFQQFSKQVAQTVKVNAFSSQSFPVFVVANAGSGVVFPSVLINATENDGASSPLGGSVLLNPDPTNPALANPDSATVGANQISINEFYNPGVANPGVANTGTASPGVANPGVANPGVANPGVANPQVITALNPGVANPGVANPGLANPGVANPGLANQALTDASYTITNEGNTSASYTVQFFQSGTLPAGTQFQIILSKLYFTQQAVGCQLQQVPTNVIVANITNPVFVTSPNQLGNPGVANLGLQTPTLNLAPGDSGQITLRTNLSLAQVESLVLPNLSPVAVSQSVNTVDVKQGIFTPPISLIVTSTSASLPLGEVRQPYNTVLMSIGGNTGARNWTIAAGSLPAGLQLNAASGAITGTPTQAGSFPFTAQVMDTGAPQHIATRALTITIVPPVVITTPSPALPEGESGSPYTQTFSATGGVSFYRWSSTGTLPPGLTLFTDGTSGLLAGTPTVGGTYNFIVRVTDAFGAFASAPYTILITNPVPAGTQIQFVTQPAGTIGGQTISPAVTVRTLTATGAAIPNVLIAMSFGTQACPAAVLSGSLTATTNGSGIATFSNLVIDRGQNNYTLAATAGTVTAVSNPFTVNGFCATGSLSTPREIDTDVLLGNGKVLIAGGANMSGNFLNTAELYDPATGTVSPTGNLTAPNGRALQASVVLPDGKVLLLGGSDSASSALATVELYDPASGTFAASGSMGEPRDRPTAVLLANGKVLLSGGRNSTSGTLSSAEIYDPATGVFSPAGNLNQARARHTMTLLPNGTVLVAGGRTFGGPPVFALASAEIFDPTANNGVGAFTSIGNMNSPRDEGRATLLPNGTVLLAGGFASYQTGTTASSAEIFDPATNVFALTGSMSISRAHPTASLLPNNTVLVAGGVPDEGNTTPGLQTAEIYNPATGTFSATGTLTLGREFAQAVILPNGNPLISGGDDGINTTATQEIYYSTAPLATLAVTTTSLPNGSTGQPYTQILLEQGGLGALTWTVTGPLPAGMSFSNQGVLSGTPIVAGSFPLTFTVTDSSTPAKSTSTSFTLTVANTPLVFTSSAVPTAVVGKPYIQALPVVGGTQPYNATVTNGTLPPGLLLSSGGVLNGTASGTGSFTFTVTVTDSSTPTKTATQTFTMAVNTLVITTTVLPNGIVGVPYSAPINTGGGTLPLSFSLTTAAFPPGLLIQQPPPTATSGALTGTPTLAGTYTFSESVVDSSNPQQTATQNYVVTIAPAGSAVPANVTFVSQPQTSVGGQTLIGGPIVVQVTDANNTPIPGTTVAMTLSGIFNIPLPCSVATLSGALTAVTNAAGQATFSNLSIDRGGFNYALMASTGSASGSSGPFSVKGFCASGNLSTPREGHTQDLLGTAQSTIKLPVDPRGTYLLTDPGDAPNPPLIVSLASLGIKPGDVISGVSVGDENACGVGQFCFGELFTPFACGVFSSSNTLLPTGGAINRVPGAIAPNFTTAFPCNTAPTSGGNLPTDIPQDFALFGERVTVPAGAAYLFVAVADIFYADNSDPNGDFGVAITVNTASSVNGKVLIAGGVGNLGNALNTAELYDPALGFTSPTGNLTDPNGRANHVSIVLPNGKVLLIGGFSNVSILATAELYDPATTTFTPTESMSQPRGLPAAVLLADGRVLVSGGFNTQVASNTAEIYDPATGLFAPTGNMNQGRGRHQMTLLPNGKVLVTGGRDAQQNFFALSSAEIFDPFANQGAGAFTAIGNMNSPRFKHTATLLSNGTVLIAGGFNGDNTSPSVASAEIFDPNTNTFAPTGSMNTPRARHTSTLLPDGTVLQAGSINGFNGVIAAAPAELYSPTSGTFTSAGGLITGRELPAATLLLPNGNVLLSGGDDGVNVLANTEVYFNPVAQTPVVITTTSVPNGFISQPYVQLLLEQGSSGPLTWSLASGTLPSGITLSSTGILSGAPTAVGSFTFTVQVTDGINTATASFTINVSLTPLAFTSNTMPAAGAARPYSQPLPITGGTLPYNTTVTRGALPPGLALSSNGILSGTPSSAGSFTFTVSVNDSSTPVQTATQTLTIAVDTLFITTTSLPSGMVGTPYNAAISTSGGTLPLTFSPATAAFPPGLAIQQPAANSHSGALAGTPTLAGHYTFSESVSDSSNPAQTATQYYVMDIFAAGTTAVPATVTFLSQPQNSVGGQILTGSPIRVHVTDANNAPIPGVSVAISFNGPPPCSTAVLSGTLNGITNANGNAVFFDLSIDRGQLGYTLLASAGSASAVSQPFNVNGFCPTSTTSVPAGAHILFIIQPGQMQGGSGGPQAVVQLFDANNAPIAGAELAASLGARPCPAATLSGTLTAVTDANGLATFSGITSNRGGQGYTGVATATSNPSVSATSNPFSIRGFCETGSMAVARNGHIAVSLPNGKVLIAGGAANALTSAEIYDPVAGMFTPISSMNVARIDPSVTVLPNGLVLIAGGFNFTTVLSSAELFDPATNTFTLVASSMTSPRSEHAATLLPNGKVLLTGGNNTFTTTVASAELFDPATNSFTASAGVMSTTRQIHHANLLPNGKVLVTGGFDANGVSLASAELYDPGTDSFSGTGSMATARGNHASAVLYTGKVLVAGGTAPTGATATAELYDPSAGTFSPTGSMTQPRVRYFSTVLGDGSVFIADGSAGGSADIYDPAGGGFRSAGLIVPQLAEREALLPDGTVLLTGGSNGSTTVTNAEIFYPTNPPFLVQEFTATGSLNTARELHTATLLSNGLVLIAGGAGSSGVSLASAELYNPATGTFTAIGNLNTGHYYHTATPLDNGQVLIAGGVDSSGNFSASAELYNPATGTFATTGSMTTSRFYHTATLLPNGTVLIAGGLGSPGLPLASAELYDPATGTFTAAGVLNSARWQHTATLLSNGLVLITGGVQITTVTASAELYDPATGTFTLTTSMTTGRTEHTATLLNNGLVLIAGGFGSSSHALANAELYNPATGTFTATGNLNTEHYIHTATLLNNLVLIAGGSDSSINPLAGAELYDPATGTFTATGSMTTARTVHTATLLPTGKVLVSGGYGNTGVQARSVQATSELYQFGAIQQLQPQSCSYEGHIKSINGDTPTAVRFVNTSTTQTFQVFWLNYTGQRVLYNTLGPGQSFIQQTFLTHPWVIADTSPAATCQEIYLPLQEQAPAIFPPAQTAHFLVDTGPGSTTLSTAPVLAAGQLLAGQFTLTTAATLDSVQAWMYVSTAGSLNVKISTDNSGLPGTAVFSKSYSMSVQPVGWALFSNYTVALAAGKYWVSFEPTTFVGNMPVGAPNPLPNYAFFNVGPWLNFGLFGPQPGLGIRISGTSP